ncbi:multidrug ABC transporter permease [Aerococcus viridans]|uniref:Multidrug ABC transporter permease n=1 Tax=Aerococcus viridans TaxID=1377 RepID=A0A2N6UAK4_9LACT|nr:multidrug ABC transporter permease [Aerococcus viridans]PMC78582.1 multidrug ABC transporter permease [Aerococcus viridans]
MFRFLRLFLFHLKVYVRNQYFLWLPIISTITIFLLQYLTANGYNNLDDPYLWIRSAIFGLWTSATTATGSIGFQRHLGTLKYLINTGINDFISLTALILPASTFGLISFPISYGLAHLFNVDIGDIDVQFIGLVLMLWLGVAVMDLLIAAFFVLTPNAIVYEELIHIPILLFSGLLGSGTWLDTLSYYTQWGIPLVFPIQKLLGANNYDYSVWGYFLSIIIWILLAIVIGSWLLRQSKKDGQGRVV